MTAWPSDRIFCFRSCMGISPAFLRSVRFAFVIIFFGFLGIHNFYLGYVVKGIVKILMSTLGIALCGMGPFISSVWGFIEGIFILCDNINYDASGRKLRKLGEKKR